jgi:KaiC/GvpD/RAD55 family RecA-like ATPase
MIERVKSGIPGLDKLIEGGFPKGSTILIVGGPGTGKTTFGLQYIYYGAKNNEPGIYVSFDEKVSEIKLAAKRYGMDFDSLEKEGKVTFIKISEKEIPDVFRIIEKNVKKMEAKRLVIDSISSVEVFIPLIKNMIPLVFREKFTYLLSHDCMIRIAMYRLIEYFKSLDVTTLLLSEATNTDFSKYGVAEFITDGIIKLEAEIIGKMLQRNLVVIKMRKTKTDGGRYSIEITNKGLKVIE